MARRKKTERNDELSVLSNVFLEPGNLKGNWGRDVFGNDNPIILEMGCGRGEYTVNMARKFPDKNFVGIDAKGPRLWKGAKALCLEERKNGAFIRTLIEHINDYFDKDEVSGIWVTFPDPYPQPARAMKRLVSLRFLGLYRNMLKPDGLIYFKTDNSPLFDWALESFVANPAIDIIRYTKDLYVSDLQDEITSIQTNYEGMFKAKGHTIKYCELKFNEQPLPGEEDLNNLMFKVVGTKII